MTRPCLSAPARLPWGWAREAAAWRDRLPAWADHLRQIADAHAAAGEEAERFARAVDAIRPIAEAVEEARARLRDAQAAARDMLAEAMPGALEAGDLPPLPDMPAPDLAEDDPTPLYRSAEAWEAATRRLIADKGEGDAP